jgi:hypothetical protein
MAKCWGIRFAQYRDSGRRMRLMLSLFSLHEIAGHVFMRCKPSLFYRFLFLRVGEKVPIGKPLLITNPDRIAIGSHVRGVRQ